MSGNDDHVWVDHGWQPVRANEFESEAESVHAAVADAEPEPEYPGPEVPLLEDQAANAVAELVAVAPVSGSGDRPVVEPPMSEAAARIAQSFIEFDGFFTQEVVEEDYLIEPWIPRGRQIRVYSKAKQGKSLLVLEAAGALAAGRAFMRRPASTPMHVLYMDFEMTRGDVRERLADMGYGEDDEPALDEYFHYASLPRVAPLDTAAGGHALAETAIAVQAEVVIIDTASRTVEGDENSNDTWQSFYQNTGMLLKQAGITFVILDHEGKDSQAGARGGSAKNDDVDVVWRLTYSDPRVVLDTRGIKRLGWVPDRIELQRLESPLRHVIKDRVYSEEEMDLALVLDELAVPIDAGRSVAKQAVKDAEEAGMLSDRQLEIATKRNDV